MAGCANNTYDGATDTTTSAAHAHTVDVLMQWNLLRSAVARLMDGAGSPAPAAYQVASARRDSKMLAGAA
jgi:hypothetical protein